MIARARFTTGHIGNQSFIGCDGDCFKRLNRGCNICPQKFRCFTSNSEEYIYLEEKEFEEFVDFVQGR